MQDSVKKLEKEILDLNLINELAQQLSYKATVDQVEQRFFKQNYRCLYLKIIEIDELRKMWKTLVYSAMETFSESKKLEQEPINEKVTIVLDSKEISKESLYYNTLYSVGYHSTADFQFGQDEGISRLHFFFLILPDLQLNIIDIASIMRVSKYPNEGHQLQAGIILSCLPIYKHSPLISDRSYQCIYLGNKRIQFICKVSEKKKKEEEAFFTFNNELNEEVKLTKMITQYMDEKGKMYLKSEELDSL